MPRQRIIGLAGHIDHGKTALVKALTGVDTDRLAEEKARGLTIDIGFAFLNREITFIDVPGHEKFIKNMVTGVATVDLALLVVAADDGVMPQTREHVDILRLLGIKQLVVALNKIDLVEPEWLNLVQEDLKSFLEENGYGDAPIVLVSAKSGEGMPALRRELEKALNGLPEVESPQAFRLAVDRVFIKKGFGTVVTGTVLSGRLRLGEKVAINGGSEFFPVRGLQSHSEEVPQVQLRDRAALNLGGAGEHQIQRGDFITAPRYYTAHPLWLARLKLLPSAPWPIKDGQPLHVYLGTGKHTARFLLGSRRRIQAGEEVWVRLHFPEPVCAVCGDRFVVRNPSPALTIGGGQLAWPWEKSRHHPKPPLEAPERLFQSSLPQQMGHYVKWLGHPVNSHSVQTLFGLDPSTFEKNLPSASLLEQASQVWSEEAYHDLREKIQRILEEFHSQHPQEAGMPLNQLPGGKDPLEFVINREIQLGHWKMHRDRLQLADFQARLTPAEEAVRDQLEAWFRREATTPPRPADVENKLGAAGLRVMDYLIHQGVIIQVDKDLFYHAETCNQFVADLRRWFKEHGTLSVSECKSFFPASRKYLIPLLNWADRKGYTKRTGDVRIWTGESLENP